MVKNIFWIAALSFLYLVFHPYWYGDAVWYATDIASGKALPVDAGHLIWRPLGFITWSLLEQLGFQVDPLRILQFFSALSSALGTMAVFQIGKLFKLSMSECLGAAVLFGGSHLCLAYGASGSSYVPAAAFGAICTYYLLQPERTTFATVAATISFLIAWSLWGVAILLLPGIFAIYFYRSVGSGLLRFVKSAAYCALLCLLIFTSLWIAHHMFVRVQFAMDFQHWLNDTNHGIAMGFGVMNLFRAAQGLIIAFIHTEALGTAVKGLILRDESLASFNDLFFPLLLAIVFVLCGCLAVFGFVEAFRKGKLKRESLALMLISIFMFVPVFCFAVAWQGSDVERFSLAVPWISLFLARGLKQSSEKIFRLSRISLPLAVALIVLVGNLLTLTLPVYLKNGGLITQLGVEARKILPPGSVLITHGQALGPRIGVVSAYFDKIEIFNLRWDVKSFGEAAWQKRVNEYMHKVWERGGQVAVLSDLLGAPTVGGISYSEKDTPIPNLNDTAKFFENFRVTGMFMIDRYQFTVVEEVPFYLTDRIKYMGFIEGQPPQME